MPVKSLKAEEISGKRVLLRCDFNVPLKDGAITDDGRIRASLPTIKFLLENGATLIILAHLGRPKGEIDLSLTLAPVAKRLSELLAREVRFFPKVRGLSEDLAELKTGEIALLENIRFEAAETSKDETERKNLATELASYADFFVSDGFGAVHRKHASVFDVAKLLPHAAGFLVAKEVEILEKLTKNPERPFGVVLGGAKVSDKLAVIENLLKVVDLLAIGGGMVFTFLAAQGFEVGNSLLERDFIPKVTEILAEAEKKGIKILLPSDIVTATEFKIDSEPSVVAADSIPKNQMGMDIGPASAKFFADEIAKCKTVFWNGPMGVFEFPNFSGGTKKVAQALTEVSGISVVGGGDSAAAVRKLGFLDSQFGYISTGGGASLEYLEGKELPGIMALS